MKRDCQCPRARHQHGTRGAYGKDGCRCFACRLASSRIQASGQWADQGVYIDRTPTILRLQALHVIGWSERGIADHLGVSKQAVRNIRVRAGHPILAATAQRITDAYDALWDQPPPGQFVARTKNWAARQGWLPPLMLDDDHLNTAEEFVHNITGKHDDETPDDIDPVAVERAMNGERIPLTRAELTQAIDTLTGMGYSADMTAARLGVSDRLVQRYRAKGRAA